MPVVLIFVSLLRNQECSHQADIEIDEDIHGAEGISGIMFKVLPKL